MMNTLANQFTMALRGLLVALTPWREGGKTHSNTPTTFCPSLHRRKLYSTCMNKDKARLFACLGPVFQSETQRKTRIYTQWAMRQKPSADKQLLANLVKLHRTCAKTALIVGSTWNPSTPDTSRNYETGIVAMEVAMKNWTGCPPTAQRV